MIVAGVCGYTPAQTSGPNVCVEKQSTLAGWGRDHHSFVGVEHDRLLKPHGAKVLTIAGSVWPCIYLLLMIDAFLHPNAW
jgi:hypothetical protein